LINSFENKERSLRELEKPVAEATIILTKPRVILINHLNLKRF